jgi:hypothetical protein
MPRTRKATKAMQAAAEAVDLAPLQDNAPPVTATTATAVADRERGPANEAAKAEPVYAADPHEKISVSLSDVRGGPSMHLLRSHKFNQMQVRFVGEQPDEQYRAMLSKKGWRDRTEEEGIYTKQIDRHAKWQSVQQMEREFRDVANAIREAKGLGPVLEGLG